MTGRTVTVLCRSQEVGGTLIGEDRLVVMAGAEGVQTHVFDAIPLIHSSYYHKPVLPSAANTDVDT